MDCETARRRLQEALDTGREDPGAVDHAAGCAECREFAVGLAEVHAFLGAEPALEWDESATDRVTEAVRRADARAPRAMVLAFRAGAAAVLVLAAWLGAGALLRIEPLREAGREVAARSPLPASPGEALGGVADALADGARGALEALAALPASGGVPAFLVAILALLVLNGIVIGRPRAAPGRRS